MLGFVDARDVDAEKWVGEPAVRETRGVREEDRDQERGDGERDRETNLAEAGVDVSGVDDVVGVAVPEENVLLEGAEG